MNQEKLLPDYGFHNFHQSTVAAFRPCMAPDREPDFISGSGSVYWDCGLSVIRASDHWAGHNGCDGQATCIWTFLGRVPPATWIAGECPYEAFRARRRISVVHDLPDTERALAERLRGAGGALPAPGFGAACPLPRWAMRVMRGSMACTPAARTLFRDRPDLSHAITASAAVLSQLTPGVTQILLGKREEMLLDIEAESFANI